jgi:hypothetical protein
MVIMAHYSFFTHMNVKKIKLKNPFGPILSFGLVKDFWKWKQLSLKKIFLQRTFEGLI